jgi:bifunctional DNA-binding transcriptional regulator/antitoxin component of YhaV-PrlF toxin-antitoxin module
MSDLPLFRLQLDEEGRVRLPAVLRGELNFKPGDTLVAECDGHSLLLRSYDDALRETQDFFRQCIPPGASVVDALTADRRAENGREVSPLDPPFQPRRT